MKTIDEMSLIKTTKMKRIRFSTKIEIEDNITNFVYCIIVFDSYNENGKLKININFDYMEYIIRPNVSNYLNNSTEVRLTAEDFGDGYFDLSAYQINDNNEYEDV